MQTARTAALALIALILTGGCQDQTMPTAPNPEALAAKGGNGGGKGGPGGGANSMVSLAGGLFTTEDQPVQVVNDGGKKLELHADKAAFQGAINLANTIAEGIGPCTTDPANVDEARKAELLARMADAVQNRFFNATVDRQAIGAASATHHVAHTWEEADGKLFSLRIGAAPALQPDLQATVTQIDTDVFRYSGGAARIADRTGSVRNHVYMACPNLDQVTVTLKR